jgi:hypothetical protein
MRQSEVDQHMRGLAFDFFYWFSRFEFALKERRYLKSKRIGAAAEPDWGTFVNAHYTAYIASTSALAIIAENPKRQVVGDAELYFEDLDLHKKASDLHKVVLCAKIVRNNLFHGGKHDYDHWDDPVRTRRLLELTIVVLAELAELGDFGGDYNRFY